MGLGNPHYPYFAPEVRALNEQEWIDFAALLDDLEADLLLSLSDFGKLWDVETAPSFLLPYIAYSFGAPFNLSDSDRVQRKKVFNAVSRHKEKGTEANAIEMIEEITGVTPRIYLNSISMYMIWSSLNSEVASSSGFMRWSARSTGSFDGMLWASLNRDVDLRALGGVVYIDLVRPKIEREMREKVKEVVEYFGASFLTYIVGVMGSSGSWREYFKVHEVEDD